MKILMTILCLSLLYFPAGDSLSAQLSKSQVKSHVDTGLKNISDQYDNFINFLRKKLQQQLKTKGVHLFLHDTLSQERKLATDKTTAKINFLQSFRLPIDSKAEKTIDNVRAKSIEKFISFYESRIDEAENFIITLKGKKEDPYHYLNLHTGQVINYVKEREKHYKDRELKIDEVIKKAQEAKMSLWK